MAVLSCVGTGRGAATCDHDSNTSETALRRHHLRQLTSGLAAATLLGGCLTTPLAHAAPSPSGPAPKAPAVDPTTPARSTVDLVPSTTATTVPGTTQRILAATPTTSREFTMLGVTWQTMPAGASAQVRVRTAAGWQAWQTLQNEATSNEGGRQGTEAVHVGDAIAAEARIVAPATTTVRSTGARLSLIDSRVLEGDGASRATVQAAATSSAVPAQPSMVTRAEWGADESLLSYNGAGCVPASIDTTIKAAIVHHTAGTNSYTASQSASIMRGIYAYHVKDRGWCDIGYNILVDKYGTIFEGRHGGVVNPVHGAHATSWNTDTVGVSVMMNSSQAKQSPEAMSAVSRILAWKLAGNYRTPTSTLTLAGKSINRIARHGDVMSTSCPGTNITAYMPTLRQDVANRMSGWQNSLIYKAYVGAGGEAKLGPVHVMERPWNGGRTTTFTNGGIYQTPENVTRQLNKAADARYRSGDGFSRLGWPTSGTTVASTSKSFVRFQKGTIHVSSVGGARATTGSIDSWLKANPTQFTRLGYPIAEAVWSSSTNVEQRFENGTLRITDGRATVTLKVGGKQGDLNGDGRADVLGVNSAGQVTWYPTQTNGTSGAATTGSLLAGAPFTWVSQVPDINGDGQTELMAIRKDGTMWAWDGRGNGQFVNARQVSTGWQYMRQPNVAPDMNKDGLPEIITIGSSQQLWRYSIASNGGLHLRTQIGTNWSIITKMTSVGDFRKAGVVDILAVTSDGRMLDYYGSPDGKISGNKLLGSGWGGWTRLRSIGDTNGDGRWDLTKSRSTGTMYNTASGTGAWGVTVAMVPDVSVLGTFA
ncbi:VCBS repeat protein [Luteococcus japonicus]|uniref:VCBS repeat protein n=1 Tax=Luteococcus japonicus TaxID=33984 RepID=A0A3N1ZYJ6_9ACTN|nr:VCBS repeat protein [Luteococcus japonicus]